MACTFPDAGQFLAANFILVIPVFVLAGAGALWYGVIWRKNSWRNSPTIVFASVLLIIGGAGTFGLAGGLVQLVRCRVSTDQIEAVRVQRISSEGASPGAQTVTLSDSVQLAEGFGHLEKASPWSANHESLCGGFRFQVRLKGESEWTERYLSAYRDSTISRDVFVVIPHVGAKHWGAVDRAGVYACPAFWKWIDEVVVPLYQKKASATSSTPKE